jgi:hypothetical protein
LPGILHGHHGRRRPARASANVLNCTLREAIDAANPTSGSDAITFQSASADPRDDPPFSPLPPITDPVLATATTQPGYSGSAAASSSTEAFLGTGAGRASASRPPPSGIQGLAVNRSSRATGIELVGAGDHRRRDDRSYVGRRLSTGVTRARGTENGVASSSQSNTIGGRRPPFGTSSRGNNSRKRQSS